MAKVKDGLVSANYQGWISEDIEIDGMLNRFFSEFVVGTPAYQLSHKGRGLYEFYKYTELAEYSLLKQDLLGDKEVKCCETLASLKEEILNSQVMNFQSIIPTVEGEYVYLYIGDYNASKFYSHHFKGLDINQKGKTKEQIHESSENRRNAVIIDKLFSHIRNSFAHGRYRKMQQNNVDYIILQDEKDGLITARLILKFDTLLKWIKHLDNRKKNIEKQ